MGADRFPMCRNEISAQWLGSVLDQDVTRIEIEQIGSDTGFAGSVFRVHLESSAAHRVLPESVIWKAHSGHRPTHRLLKRLGAYATETAFFRSLAPHTPLAPRPYYAEYDPDSGTTCIIQEDLGRLRAGNQISGCTLRESSDVMVALAGLHSTFWTACHKHRLRTIPSYGSGARLFQRLHTRSWDRLRSSGVAPSELVEAAEGIAPHVAAIKAHLSRPPVTLLHGDARSDNLFFGPAPAGSVRLIDWQAARMGRCAYDVAYFLSTSVPTWTRVQEQDALITEYLEALSAAGVDRRTPAEFMRDLRIALLDVVTFVGIIAATLDFGSPRGLELSRVIMSRLSAAIEDNEALEVLDRLMPEGPE